MKGKREWRTYRTSDLGVYFPLSLTLVYILPARLSPFAGTWIWAT